MSKQSDNLPLINVELGAMRFIYQELRIERESKKQRLYRTCLKMLEQGFWNPGDRLPTDLVLAEQLPVSLGTVQTVFRRLKEENLIVRNKRGGTYVSSSEQINHDYQFFHYLKSDGKTSIPYKIEKIDMKVVNKKGPWTEFLDKSTKCIQISRSINFRDEFQLYSEFYLSYTRFKSLLEIQKDQLKEFSIKNLLHVRFGLPTLNTEWHFNSFPAKHTSAKKLKIKVGTMCSLFDVRGYSLDNQPLLFHRIIAPCNSCVMKIIS